MSNKEEWFVMDEVNLFSF